MCGRSKIDYINAHGTSTPAGDITELNAIKSVFGDDIPRISSTKSLSGHSLGAAGVQESIYGLIMLKEQFIVGSANIENLDEGAEDFPIVRENISVALNRFLSNSFGFGGTNATLIFEKP
jgi:3-oxoacyl-[acyl-carrier-protein] synthase-1